MNISILFRIFLAFGLVASFTTPSLSAMQRQSSAMLRLLGQMQALELLSLAHHAPQAQAELDDETVLNLKRHNIKNPDELVLILNNMEKTQREKIIKLSLANKYGLKDLPADLAHLLPNLRILDLHNTRMSMEALFNIPKSVQEIDLSYNNLYRLPIGFFNRLPNLRILNLSGMFMYSDRPIIYTARLNFGIEKAEKVQEKDNLNQKRDELVVEQQREKNDISHIARSLGELTNFLMQNIEINGLE